MTYKAYSFIRASIKSGDSDWLPLDGVQAIEMNMDMSPVDTGWRLVGDRLFHVEFSAHVRWSRILRRRSPRHVKVSRRKIWRYMERHGL